MFPKTTKAAEILQACVENVGISGKPAETLHPCVGNVASILRSVGKYDFGTRAFVVALRL